MAIEKQQVIEAVERGKDWLLENQITEETETYDQIRFLDDDKAKAEWYEIPTPKHLIGAYYGNLCRNDPHATKDGEVRRQYYNSWHTGQVGVALLDYLEYKDDPAVQKSVDLAWDFIDSHQLKDGEYKGVFVEIPPADLQYPLENHHSFGHTSEKAKNGYADYDNIETDLFPLELYRKTGDKKYLESAKMNADFYLEKHPEIVFFDIETNTYAISGMSNDAVYGRLFEYTKEDKYRDVFSKQLQKLSFLGLDLRAGNNIRNMYWDATACEYAVDNFPEMYGPAMAKLAFLCEHLLAAQKDNGVLWFRFKDAGVPHDTADERKQDGAATYGTMRMWGKMYDMTGDKRWLNAIKKGVEFALTQQYPDSHGKEFAGAFEYAGVVLDKNTGKNYESLRDISTIFALRALIPLLTEKTQWAKDFWNE